MSTRYLLFVLTLLVAIIGRLRSGTRITPQVKAFGFPVAFVAQNGCTLDAVPKDADWIFIGGLDPWKQENIHNFIGDRPVHVGRVNGKGRVNYCKWLGVKSIDGTGWWKNHYRNISALFEEEKQCSLF